jgi:DUF4097 and DUF4098 domain-containing protein YvlB
MQAALFTSIFLAVSAVPALAQHDDDCRHEAQRNTTIAVQDAKRLVVEAGSGSLKIVGKPGISHVRVSGRACASSAELLEQITLRSNRSGGDIVIEANMRDRRDNDWSFRDNQYARLDVEIEVPARMAAEIHDGSGSIDLSNLGALVLEDGSGDIVADNLNGDVDIEDGSGGIRLVDVAGRVKIDDGSGEITLRNVGGLIDIDDSSGEIDIRVARNTVRISDSSGSIDVSDVAGDFIVMDDGSGSIDYDNVKGKVDIPRRKGRR